MESIIIIVLLVLCIVLLTAVLAVLLTDRPSTVQRSLSRQMDESQESLARDLQEARRDLTAGQNSTAAAIAESVQNTVGRLGGLLQQSQRQAAQQQADKIEQLQRSNQASMEQLRRANQDSMESLRRSSVDSMESLRTANRESMELLRQENNRKLEDIRVTVDEKLQETLNRRIAESFRTVSTQLEQVYKGLGEMQTLAGDVGSLKQVLSGVKTRGILGEIQLGAILQEILAPEQYETNVATIPGSREWWSMPCGCPAGRTGRCICPLTPSSPATPTPGCWRPASRETRRRWRLPCGRWRAR